MSTKRRSIKFKEKKKSGNEEATLELLRDLWLTTPLTVPTVSKLSSLRMTPDFMIAKHEEKWKAKRMKKKEAGSRALNVSASDVSREDFERKK